MAGKMLPGMADLGSAIKAGNAEPDWAALGSARQVSSAVARLPTACQRRQRRSRHGELRQAGKAK